MLHEAEGREFVARLSISIHKVQRAFRVNSHFLQ